MENPNSGTKKDAAEPSDATSSKTLSDLEDTEKVSGASQAEGDPGPSPDGQLDESDEKENVSTGAV